MGSAADVAFDELVGGHAAISEDEAGHAVGREVVDEVLHPGEVGVARRRRAILTALVALRPLGAPVEGVIEEGQTEADVLGHSSVPAATECVGHLPAPGSAADVFGGRAFESRFFYHFRHVLPLWNSGCAMVLGAPNVELRPQRAVTL